MKTTFPDDDNFSNKQKSSGNLSPNIGSNWHGSIASGDINGPYAGGDVNGIFVGRDYITTTSDSYKTPVKFESPKESVITEQRSLITTIFAGLGTIASGIESYNKIINFFQFDLNIDAVVKKIFTFEFLNTVALWVALFVILFYITIKLSLYTRRRYNKWPEVKGKFNFFRSLYPSVNGKGFVRANAYAVCRDCMSGNRDGNWRRIKAYRKDRETIGYYKCNIPAHGMKTFDIYSIFAATDKK